MPEATRLSKGAYTPGKRIRIDQAEEPTGFHVLTDEELYARHVDGCKRSFAILFERHNAKLVRRLETRFRLTGSIAEEAAQEVWCRIADTKAVELFAGLLAKMARDKALEVIRKAKRRKIYQSHINQEGRNVELTADRVAVVDEQVSALRQAVQRLPAAMRKLMQLVFFDSMSIRQAAISIGMPLTSANRQIEEAKTMLKQYLT